MGVDKAFRGQKVGHWILAYVVGLARTLSKEMGVRYVTLDALSRPSLVNWYARYGFIENQGETDRRTAVLKFFKQWKSGQQMDTISMRYDILLQDEVVGD